MKVAKGRVAKEGCESMRLLLLLTHFLYLSNKVQKNLWEDSKLVIVSKLSISKQMVNLDVKAFLISKEKRQGAQIS